MGVRSLRQRETLLTAPYAPVRKSPTNTSQFWRADGSWALPPSGPGGGGTDEEAVQLIVDDAIAALIDGAPAGLNTLNELADAVGNSPTFSADTAAALATKVPLSVVTTADDLIVGTGNAAVTRLGVGASRLIGKKASGGIGALTPTEAKAILAIAAGDVSGLTAAIAVVAATDQDITDAIAALSAAVVHTSGAETIAGVKTFSSAPAVPDDSFTVEKISTPLQLLDANLTAITELTVAAYGLSVLETTSAAELRALLDLDQTPVAGGNLGSTETVNLANEPELIFKGTLNANCAITLTGFPTGRRGSIEFTLTQDATGSRTISFTNTIKWQHAGLIVTNGVPVVLSSAAGTETSFIVWSDDGGATIYGEHSGVIRQRTLYKAGTLSSGAGKAISRYLTDARIFKVQPNLGGAPVSTAAVFDIDRNGDRAGSGTIYTTQANRPSVAAAAITNTAVALPDVVLLAPGDYLTVDVDTPSSSTDLAMDVWTMEAL